MYIELNPVRAGLCKRPEQWKESCAYLRWLGQDRYLMSLGTIFPEIGKKQRYAHYRGSLLYRGMKPSQERQQAIDPEIVRIEQREGFTRPGLYLKRLRFLSDGLILGTADEIRDQESSERCLQVAQKPDSAFRRIFLHATRAALSRPLLAGPATAGKSSRETYPFLCLLGKAHPHRRRIRSNLDGQVEAMPQVCTTTGSSP